MFDEKKKGVTGSTLKIVAIITMFIDHLSACMLTGYLESHGLYSVVTPEQGYAFLAEYGRIYYIAQAMRMIGRIAFPIFIFCLVEGFFHTRSRVKYLRNLAIFALVTELPFNLCFSGKLFYPEYQSVMVTMLLGVLSMSLMEKVKSLEFKEKMGVFTVVEYLVAGFVLSIMFIRQYFTEDIKETFSVYGLYILAATIVIGGLLIVLQRKRSGADKNCLGLLLMAMIPGICLGFLLKTDYNGWGVLAICVTYLFHGFENKFEHKMCCLTLMIMNPVEGFAFLGFPLVKSYNGQRGLKMKYFFYAFYPVHIFLIYIFTYIFGWIGFAIK